LIHVSGRLRCTSGHTQTVEFWRLEEWREPQDWESTMSSSTLFFDELGRRGHEPLLRRVSATVRFEVADDEQTEHRLLVIDRGDLRVSVDEAVPDATIRCSSAEFDDLVKGRTSPMASLLRGALTVDGDPELLVLAQRLFSRGPVAASERRSGPTGQGPS
jgi:Putative sterol carrier protein